VIASKLNATLTRCIRLIISSIIVHSEVLWVLTKSTAAVSLGTFSGVSIFVTHVMLLDALASASKGVYKSSINQLEKLALTRVLLSNEQLVVVCSRSKVA